MPTTTRDELHRLVDRLAENKLNTARDLLEDLVTRSGRPSLAEVLASAPLDDEELTAEEIAAIEEGRRALAEGRIVSDA